MDSKLVMVGKYNKAFNPYLHYDMDGRAIYQSTGLAKHIHKRHPECLKFQTKHESMTFKAAAAEYIESKRNVLSPSTLRLYKVTMNNISDKLKSMNIHDISTVDIQTEINHLAKEHSPKTVRNYHGFISTVLGTFCPALRFVLLCRKKSKMIHIFLLTMM